MDNFNSEGYLRELKRRNIIRDKLEEARLRRINLYEAEELYGKQDTPSLLSRIFKERRADKKMVKKHKVDLKLPTVINLFTASNELKQTYKEEKENIMDLLETIRLLRGISKLDFYSGLGISSDDSFWVWKREILTQHETNANKIVNDNDYQTERILSPIANQLLTPERVSSPEYPSLTANISPDPYSSEESLSGELEAITISDRDTSSHVEQADVVKEDPHNVAELKPPSKHKYKKTRGCKVDTRWPKGHKLFTQPSPQKAVTAGEHNGRFVFYKQMPEKTRKANDEKQFKKREVKLQKLCQEHETLKRTLLRLAYEKHCAFLRTPSLTLFPFQKSATMFSVDLSRHSSIHTTREMSYFDYLAFHLE